METKELPSKYAIEFGKKAELEWLRTHNDRDYSVKASYIQNLIAQVQFLNKQVDNIYTFVNEECVKKSSEEIKK